MLGKQAWCLLTKSNSLVAQIFKARYFPKSSFAEAALGYNPSFVWGSIMAAKRVVVKGSHIQVGSGQSVKIDMASWLPDSENGYVTTKLNSRLANTPVSSLMVPSQRRWDYDLVNDIFNVRDRDLILKILLSTRRECDEWCWLADPRRVCSVHSCYKLLAGNSVNPNNGIWNKLWNLEVPGNVKNFIWRAVTNVVPTADNLRRKQVDVQSMCGICSASDKSLSCILADCSFAKSCWVSSPIGFIGGCSSFMHWLERIFSHCSKEDCNLAAMICWRLWVNRNDKVWNNKIGHVRSILNSAGQMLFEWQKARKQCFFTYETGNAVQGSICWECPPVGWLKCNVDAATFDSRGMVRFGGVLRSSEENFVAAKCTCFAGGFGVRDAEALGKICEHRRRYNSLGGRYYVRSGRMEFFKDRHSLEKDWGNYFSDDSCCPDGNPKVVLEVGCGAGNTIFPIVAAYPELYVHACYISPHAIELVKAHSEFREEQVNAFVCNVVDDDLSRNVNHSSVDVVTLIFLLSAVSPKKMPLILQNIKPVLKPDGYILVRDYAVGDFAQVKL